MYPLVQGVLSNFVERICHQVLPLHDREYVLLCLREENEALKGELASYEVKVAAMEGENKKLEYAY